MVLVEVQAFAPLLTKGQRHPRNRFLVLSPTFHVVKSNRHHDDHHHHHHRIANPKGAISSRSQQPKRPRLNLIRRSPRQLADSAVSQQQQQPQQEYQSLSPYSPPAILLSRLPSRLAHELQNLTQTLQLEAWMQQQQQKQQLKQQQAPIEKRQNKTFSSSSSSTHNTGVSSVGRRFLTYHLTSYQQVDVIRYLRQCQAYRVIPLFLHACYSSSSSNHFLLPEDSHVYAAAMAALASSPDQSDRKHVFVLWNQFQENNHNTKYHNHTSIVPLPSMWTALFQASAGASAAMQWHQCWQTEYPQVRWNSRVYEAAMTCCGRLAQTGHPKNDRIKDETAVEEAVETALFFFRQQLEQSLLTRSAVPPRTLSVFIEVCAATQQVDRAVDTLHGFMVQQRYAPVLSAAWVCSWVWLKLLHACAVAENDHAAWLVLHRMVLHHADEANHSIKILPDIRHYTCYMKALVSTGKVDKALHLLDYLCGSADPALATANGWDGWPQTKLDLVSIYTVLPSCSYQQGRALLDRMRRGVLNGLLPDHQYYHILLTNACENPQHAKDLVYEMHISRRHRTGAVPPQLITYTKAVAVCRKAADVETAFFFLQRAKEDGIQPDLHLYSAVLWTAAQAADSEAALRVWNEMRAKHCSPNVVSYNGMIASFTGCGKTEEALTTFQEMLKNGIRPTLTSFVHLEKCARRIVDVGERLYFLTEVFQSLEPEECKVQICGPILDTLIQDFGSLGMYQEARYVFDSIKGPIDAACLRAMMFACSMESPPEWQEALTLLHSSDIVTGTSGPYYMDQVALSHTMIACSKANEWEESLNLLRLYGSNKTSIAAFNSLIGSCGRAGRPDLSMEVLNDMESFGLTPGARSFRNAIIACNQAQHHQRRCRQQEALSNPSACHSAAFEWWECALSLLRRMKEAGLQPCKQCYSSVISACEAAGEWQRALHLLQQMMDDQDESEALNLYCFNAAISACEKGGAWVEALEVYERMKGSGRKELRPTIITLSSLVQAVDKAGQKELAQSLYVEGVKRKIVNPWRTTRDKGGKSVRAMDLHSFSAAMARAAVRHYLESLLLKSSSRAQQGQSPEDLMIIVGKGLRSEQEPVLLPTVYRLLRYEYSMMDLTIDPANTGRIVVPKAALMDFIVRKSWK